MKCKKLEVKTGPCFVSFLTFYRFHSKHVSLFARTRFNFPSHSTTINIPSAQPCYFPCEFPSHISQSLRQLTYLLFPAMVKIGYFICQVFKCNILSFIFTLSSLKLFLETVNTLTFLAQFNQYHFYEYIVRYNLYVHSLFYYLVS